MNILREATTEAYRINAFFLSYKVSPSIEILYDVSNKRYTCLKVLTKGYDIVDNRFVCGWDKLYEEELFDLEEWTVEHVLYLEMSLNA